jgi:hypothetical protein
MHVIQQLSQIRAGQCEAERARIDDDIRLAIRRCQQRVNAEPVAAMTADADVEPTLEQLNAVRQRHGLPVKTA